MESYRLFIAADLPAAIKAALVATQQQLRQGNPPVKWVAPTAMHLTLRFLGETNIGQLPSLGAALSTALAQHGALRLRLNGVGAFPNERQPSVVWTGIGGELATLARMQAAIEAAVIDLGFAPETRLFRAHLTLGRVQREAGQEQQEQLGAAIRALPPPAALEWTVERVVLFRSELHGDGPVYTEIAECRLQSVD